MGPPIGMDITIHQDTIGHLPPPQNPVDTATFLPVHRISLRSRTEYSDSFNNQSRVALHSGGKTKQSFSFVSERVHGFWGTWHPCWHLSTHQATHERFPNVSTTPVESQGRPSLKKDIFGPVGKGKPIMLGGPDQLESRGSYTRSSSATCIITDASMSGWGAHWENRTVSGKWSSKERDHIYALELRAVMLAMAHWELQLQNKRTRSSGGRPRFYGQNGLSAPEQ